jgi:hypothetical protein
MPLTLPNLDDRTFRDLVDEGRAMIAGIAPEWTNYNAADPGITLMELFAYVTEILIYRTNQITDEDLLTYLRLLNGMPPGWRLAHGADLNTEVRKAILALYTPFRAVTPEDFERLALAADPNVARAHAVPDRDLWARHRGGREQRPGHVSVVVVPREEEEGQSPSPTIEAVRQFLEPRRLIATRVHAGPPRYVKAGFRLTLAIQPGASAVSVRADAIRRIRLFVDPVAGGPDGHGWPFGRAIYVSEIYEMLDAMAEVDFVTRNIDPGSGRNLDELFTPDGPPSRIQRAANGDVIALLLEPGELIDPQIDDGAIQIQPETRAQEKEV